MQETSLTSRTVGQDYRQPFLETHRALSSCTRELSRLMDDVTRRAVALHAAGTVETPVVRQTPSRCIVQLGPVALTAGWLRGSLDSVADGELLVIVWRGSVAPVGDHQFERARAGRAPVAAELLWEDVLVADALSEADWGWQSRNTPGARFTSRELAERCMTQLERSHSALRIA